MLPTIQVWEDRLGQRDASRESGSHVTLRWREMDSNSWSPLGDTPQRPLIASPGIISAKSWLALRTKGFDFFAEILRAFARCGHKGLRLQPYA
jgi:hypothetical protein